jgi:hypothetical protein
MREPVNNQKFERWIRLRRKEKAAHPSLDPVDPSIVSGEGRGFPTKEQVPEKFTL